MGEVVNRVIYMRKGMRSGMRKGDRVMIVCGYVITNWIGGIGSIG